MASAVTQCSTSELTCSICTDYLTDPVTICCGHRFCNPCLCLLWEDALTPNCCPVCREISQQMYFKRIIFAEKQAIPTGESVSCQLSSSAMLICGRHQEIKNLICATDRSLLCFLCSQSPRHATHKHYMTKEADEYYREKKAEKSKKSKQRDQHNQNVENGFSEESCILMRAYHDLRSMMISAEYPKVCQYLREEEQKHLEGLAREGRIVFEQLKISQTRMAKMSVLLRGMFEKLKEMSCKADVNLPQDLGDIMKRNEFLRLAMPQPVNPQLSAWTITGMSERLNFFRVDDPLSKERASHYMNLSEDVRNVIFGDDHDGAPRESQRAENFAAWGAQAFSSGKHYWEVDVTHSSNWILGVCKDSRTANTNAFEEAFFLFSSKRNNLYSLSNIFAPLTHYVQRPLGQVGVFLDYDNTVVSFYDVSKGSLIYSFFPSSLSSLLTPFFCIG
ncbi:hypothetical protein EGK_06758, partial [Macaca mulatta]